MSVCPFDALSIQHRRASPLELAGYRHVFVWVELEENGQYITPRKVSLELLGKGRQLADALGEELVGVVIGSGDGFNAAGLGNYGADRVIVCGHKLLQQYTTDGYTQAICAIIAAKMPSILLYGATLHGRDLAPRVAARLRLGLTADCTGLAIDETGQLVQTRPAFGGNIMASIITPYTRPQTATVRPNVFPLPEQDPDHMAVVEEFALTMSLAAIRTRVIERKILENNGKGGIADANVIISGGRGCQKSENLGLLQRLAKQLDGVLAGSRAIVEQGWIPHTLQVGQSGTTVNPQLYLAAGISGAVQHLVGMRSAKHIIAINKDPEAPILQAADLGIVGDALEILPILSRLLEEYSQEHNRWSI